MLHKGPSINDFPSKLELFELFWMPPKQKTPIELHMSICYCEAKIASTLLLKAKILPQLKVPIANLTFNIKGK